VIVIAHDRNVDRNCFELLFIIVKIIVIRVFFLKEIRAHK